jgi:hypothetical protein
VPNDADVAAAWWRYQRLAAGSRPERKAVETGEAVEEAAAAETVRQRVEQGGVSALRLLVTLADGAVDDLAAAVVGAGPVEDFVVEHGDELCDEIAAAARREPKFREALRTVWLSAGELRPESERMLAPWVPSLTNGTSDHR